MIAVMIKSLYLLAAAQALKMQARNCEDPYYELLCENGIEPNTGGNGYFATEEVCLEAGQCYNLEVTEGGWPEEVFFDFLGIVAGAPYSGEFCVPDNEPCLTMYMYDTYGDGWNGAEYVIYTGEVSAVGTMEFDWGYDDWYYDDWYYDYDDWYYDDWYSYYDDWYSYYDYSYGGYYDDYSYGGYYGYGGTGDDESCGAM